MSLLPAMIAVSLSILRRAYLILGTFTLYGLGLWSTGWGHGPYTFLEAIGSWITILLRLVFTSVHWGEYSNNEDAMLLMNIGIAVAPVGFLAYYVGMKWSINKYYSRSAYRLQLVLHIAGSILAAAWGTLSRLGSGAVTTHLAFGIAGIVAAGLFVEGDILLQRLEYVIGRNRTQSP